MNQVKCFSERRRYGLRRMYTVLEKHFLMKKTNFFLE